MVKTIGIGKQDFASVIEDNCFCGQNELYKGMVGFKG